MAEERRGLSSAEVTGSEASVVATASCWCWCWCSCSWASLALRFRAKGRRIPGKGLGGAGRRLLVEGSWRLGLARSGGALGTAARSCTDLPPAWCHNAVLIDVWHERVGTHVPAGRAGSRGLGCPAGVNRPRSRAQPGRSCSGCCWGDPRRRIIGVASWGLPPRRARNACSTQLGVRRVQIHGGWGAQNAVTIEVCVADDADSAALGLRLATTFCSALLDALRKQDHTPDHAIRDRKPNFYVTARGSRGSAIEARPSSR